MTSTGEPTSEDRAAALEVVRDTTESRERADAVAAAARDEQSLAIRRAIAAGVAVTAIQAVTGFSHARVYQIRDGRR